MAVPDERTLVVLHVLEALESGCARHVVDVVAHTPGVRHVVAVPSERVGGVTDRHAVGRIEAAGGTVHVVEMRRRPHDAHNVAALARLHRLVATLRPDVVHGHSSIGGVLARVVGTVGRVRPARVYTPNGLAAGRGPTAVERALGPLTDALVAVSASERAEVLRRRLVPDDRLHVVANGIEPVAPAPVGIRSLVDVPAGVPIVGSMGRLAPQKAPEVLVEAFRIVADEAPDAHFVLIGDGPQAAEVDAAARRLGGRFHRIPSVPDAARYLGDLDVFVLTSRFEGGPYAPLEAMRAGVAVVLTDVVGSADTVEHGRTGLLSPPDDPSGTAAAVLRLLRDPDERARLAAAGHRAVVDRFDVARMGRALRAVYGAAIDRRKD
jgi:glycosyltransferase involved in cell wall biosynthesis